MGTLKESIQAIGVSFIDEVIAGFGKQRQTMIDYWAGIMKILASMIPALPSLTPTGVTAPTGPTPGAAAQGLAAAGASNRSYQNTFNVTISAPGGDPGQVRRATEQGVLSAARAMGMR